MNIARNSACLCWLASGLIPYDRLYELMKTYGDAEGIYLAYQKNDIPEELIHSADRKLLDQHRNTDDLRRYWKCMESHSIHVIDMNDMLYPDLLREIQEPPPILFYQGDISILSERKKAAIVGSRKASVKGQNATEIISRRLAENQVVIISGMALGIDTAAHKGCLQAGGKTAAVMGCGLDIVYPAYNAKLKQQILDSGGVILGEYAPGEKPLGFHFPYRNRIISGLSDIVILMEARIQSGSMTTVTHALAQGRDIYSYPGDPDSSSFEANHQILREGAIFFTKAQDILDDMHWEQDLSKEDVTSDDEPELTDTQKTILKLIRQGTISYSDIVTTTGLNVGIINEELTILQILDLIHALPGKQYVANE